MEMLFGAKHFLSILTLILKYKGKHLNDVFQILRNYLLFYFNTKSLFDFIYKKAYKTKQAFLYFITQKSKAFSELDFSNKNKVDLFFMKTMILW